MNPIRIKIAPAATSTTAIAAAQTLGAAGNMVLATAPTFATVTQPVTGATQAIAVARKITLTSTGNISGVNFTITGLSADGIVQSEVLAGPNNNTVTSTLYYQSPPTSIAADAAVATNTSAGMSLFALGPVVLDRSIPRVSIQVTVTGTINYTVQFSEDDPYQTAVLLNWLTSTDANLVSQTGNSLGNAVTPLALVRLISNSFSTGATATLTIIQEDDEY